MLQLPMILHRAVYCQASHSTEMPVASDHFDRKAWKPEITIHDIFNTMRDSQHFLWIYVLCFQYISFISVVPHCNGHISLNNCPIFNLKGFLETLHLDLSIGTKKSIFRRTGPPKNEIDGIQSKDGKLSSLQYNMVPWYAIRMTIQWKNMKLYVVTPKLCLKHGLFESKIVRGWLYGQHY